MIGMNTAELVQQIDLEISRLQKVRDLLSDSSPTRATRTSSSGASPVRKKRTLSPEARARIAAAQKKRWAAQKKAATSKKATPAKKAAGQQPAAV
jgi:hypothetical protein